MPRIYCGCRVEQAILNTVGFSCHIGCTKDCELYLKVDKNILRRRLGVLENLYSRNLLAFYYSLSMCMVEVTLGDIACFP